MYEYVEYLRFSFKYSYIVCILLYILQYCVYYICNVLAKKIFIKMSGLGCWKVHWTFRTAIYVYRTFLLYIPDFVISRGTTRHDQLRYRIFLWRWLTIWRPVSRAVPRTPDPDAWFPMRRRIFSRKTQAERWHQITTAFTSRWDARREK